MNMISTKALDIRWRVPLAPRIVRKLGLGAPADIRAVKLP